MKRLGEMMLHNLAPWATIINSCTTIYFLWRNSKLEKENKKLKQHIKSMQIVLDVQIERIINENI